ncbi:MAG: hypothetical protein WBP26_06160 [Candidatus Saccharimonadales bacterium]
MLSKTCPACGKGPVVYDNGFERCENCSVYKVKLPFYKQPLLWAEGRLWWPRALVLAYLGYVYLTLRAGEAKFALAIDMFDLGIHELGHVLFRPFGEFMAILGGSLFQCLFPLLWLGALWWKRWYFGACVCLWWLGFNLYNVAAYIADARARVLPLATFNSSYDDAHDWYQLLLRTDNLANDTTIAAGVRIAGDACIIAGLLLGTALVIKMLISSYHAKHTTQTT